MQEPTDLTGFSHIEVLGAREHNLKNIDVSIPRNQLVVITGISGSGKSSLAFDTIYAEGQRRYMESFSAYARSFLGNMERPDVDKIEGLSPVISIEQKLHLKILDRRWVRPPRFMIFFAFYMPARPKLFLTYRGKNGEAVGRSNHSYPTVSICQKQGSSIGSFGERS